MKTTITRTITLCLAMIAAPVLAATSSPPDGWITSKSKLTLWTSAGVGSIAVHVDTIDGVVTLYGKVPNLSQKAIAEKTVRGIKGVRAVNNLLQVVAEKDEKRIEIADKEIKENIERALADDQMLKDSKISVKAVDKGLVILTGKAASFSDHVHAVAITKRVPGVRRTTTQISSPELFGPDERTVFYLGEPSAPPPTSALTDMRINTQVKLRLLTTAYIPSNEVNVDTDNAVVTLFGMVPTEAAKAGAENEATKVAGVLRVQNELQIVPSSLVKRVEAQDKEIAKEVKAQFKGRNELTRVDTEVKNRVVRLTGTVGSGWDKLNAVRLARFCRGVASVEDDLKVKPEPEEPPAQY